MSETGRRVATYPGAALTTQIISWAAEKLSHPDDVWEDYQKRPEGYRLMWAWRIFKAEEENKALEQERRKGGRSR